MARMNFKDESVNFADVFATFAATTEQCRKSFEVERYRIKISL